MRYLYKITILLIFCLFVVQSNAQYKKHYKILDGLTIGPRAGVNMFYGDLVDKSRNSFSLGFIVEREFTTYLSGRFQAIGGQLRGSQLNPSTDEINAYFKTFYVEYSFGASFRPLSLILGYFKQRSFKPYVISQISLIQYSAKEWYGAGIADGNRIKDGDLWREKSGLTPAASVGGGLAYWFSPYLTVNLELLATAPFGDELDAHSEWSYYDSDGNETVVQTQANDFNYTLTAGITYTIKDSRWKNEPKYNRKAYLKTKRALQYKPKKSSYYNKRNKKRR